MMRSTEVSLGEKFKLYKTHNDKLDPYGAKTPSETQLALIEELKKYDFSKHGSAKEIITFVKELCDCTYKMQQEVLAVALPFMDFNKLTLKEVIEEIRNWGYTFMNLVKEYILQKYDWTKHKKEVLIKAAKETQSNETFWKHLINSNVLSEDDLDVLLFGQKVTAPKISVSSIELSGLLIPMKEHSPRKLWDSYVYHLQKAIYESTVSNNYKRKMLLWEDNQNTIATAICSMFSSKLYTHKLGNKISEKEILEIALRYGQCKPDSSGSCANCESVYDMAMSCLEKPANLLKVARLMKTASGWGKIIRELELSKQAPSKVLRIAKISGYTPIWQIFFNVNKNQIIVPHEELMRIGEKSKDLALWAVLLKHVDYSKIAIEWVFKFIKRCGQEVVPHMQQICHKKYQSSEACHCMEAVSSRFDWKSVSYEKKIEALNLHYISYWQNPIIDALEKIEVKDFLALNAKFKGVNEKLQSKVLTEA